MKAVRWLLDVGRRRPPASPVPKLVAGVWYMETDQTEVVAANGFGQ